MTTTEAVGSAEAAPIAIPPPAPETFAEAQPRFEQTMQGLLDMLRSLPREGSVTVSMLTDWVLPLFEDARDEYHALSESAVEQLTDIVDQLDTANAGIDNNTRQVVFAAIGLAALAFKRAGWVDEKNGKLELTVRCPKDLAEEYTKVQNLVQLWASGADIAALAAAQE